MGDKFDECYTDNIGNHIFVKKCGREGAPKILIDCHYDEIGMMVSSIKEGTSQSEMLACMLYPHFYQVYYYEPEVKASEVLDEQFKAGNWYAPSAAEWARIVYYRGYSAAGANFVRDEEDQALKAQISKTITNGKTPQTTPVFSLVANSGMTALPAVWTSLYDSKAAYRTGRAFKM